MTTGPKPYSSLCQVLTLTLQIIHDRISPAVSSDGGVWNSDPGALLLRREYSDVAQDFPFQGTQGLGDLEGKAYESMQYMQ